MPPPLQAEEGIRSTAIAVEVAKLYQVLPLFLLEDAMIETAQAFARELDDAMLQPRWHVAYVVARHEKVVAQELSRRSVEPFLPLYHEVHCWNKRQAQVELPLFPSYVFVRMTFRERLRVLQVPAVVHLVTFNGLPASVPEEEIEGLRTAARLRRVQPHPYYSVGDRVRIKAGPLIGLEGVLVKQQSSSRIIVAVDFIHRAVSVELEPNDLEGVL
jgi:transcription antitermination factor NusG